MYNLIANLKQNRQNESEQSFHHTSAQRVIVFYFFISITRAFALVYDLLSITSSLAAPRPARSSRM